jgi:FkbM family methyltransferase
LRDIVFLIEREVMSLLQDGLDRSFGYRIGSITKAGDPRRRICVEGTTLDSYCESRNIRPAGFKINVEGAERIVIKGGGENTIANCSSWI